jgi:hypothetical protein
MSDLKVCSKFKPLKIADDDAVLCVNIRIAVRRGAARHGPGHHRCGACDELHERHDQPLRTVDGARHEMLFLSPSGNPGRPFVLLRAPAGQHSHQHHTPHSHIQPPLWYVPIRFQTEN